MDYQQLALRFILSDADNERTQLSQLAAEKLAASPLEIRDWILSVSKWLSPEEGNDDDSDMIVYGKAVDFLSSTLDQLDKDRRIFKEAQVGLLVTFFCNILQNHHGGVLPSCRALASLASMPSFPATRAVDILDGLENMGDYLRRQMPGTRLVVYRLLQSLVSSQKIKPELESRPGPRGAFIKGILDLCRNERDPACLLAWFGVLESYLRSYTPAADMVEMTFSVFSSYFPITVRASQTPAGITGEDLKEALRNCFAAHDVVAPFAVPYLTTKLERGDGLTLSVRSDILKTVDACLGRYDQVATTITPHADKLWSTLKYEVRSGDEPDAVKLALQAIRTLTRRFEGADLMRLLSTVASDCHEDLTVPSHAEAAGKLVAVVMSAQPPAFNELAPKTIDFLRRQLAGSSSALHLRDLVIVLNSILELRPSAMGPAAGQGVQVKDLARLFDETYAPLMRCHTRPDADEDDLAVARKALRGLGLLATQPVASTNEGGYQRLLDEEICRQICVHLSKAVIENRDEPKLDVVVQEAAAALAHMSPVYGDALRVFTGVAFGGLKRTQPSPSLLRWIAPVLAFIGTRELPATGDQLDRFVYVVATFLRLLQPDSSGAKPSAEASGEIVLGILNAMVQFRSRFIPSACQVILPKTVLEDRIVERYPDLPRFDARVYSTMPSYQPRGQQSLEESFFTLCFFVTRNLFKQATTLGRDETTGELRLSLSAGDHSKTEKSGFENVFLVTIGRIATFTLRHIEPANQISLDLPSQIFYLFQPIELFVGGAVLGSLYRVPIRNAWKLILSSPETGSDGIAQLSLGIAEGIAPNGVQTLRDDEPVHAHFLKNLVDYPEAAATVSSATEALLASIANRFPVGAQGSTLDLAASLIVHATAESSLTDADRLALMGTVAVVTGAIMRHAKGGKTGALLERLAQTPAVPRIGHQIGRKLERVVAPILDRGGGLSVVIPTWKAKTYHQLVRPMLEQALPKPDLSKEELLVCSNYRIAVLGMLRWLDFAIYEDDADMVLRASICLAQDLPSGREAASALLAIKTILGHNPGATKSHLNTLVRIFQQILQPQQSEAPAWMPADYADLDASPRTPKACQVLALDILMLIGQKYEKNDSQMQSVATSVNRVLTTASGLGSRSLREKARLARNLWRTINA